VTDDLAMSIVKKSEEGAETMTYTKIDSSGSHFNKFGIFFPQL
jgi:hypothetical protein